MKKNLKRISSLILIALAFASCNDNDNENRPSAAQFKALQSAALEHITQHFQFNAEAGAVVFTSAKGVTINISGGCLTLNGNPVTGTVDLEYVEIFDGGTMAVTNKPTRGIMPNGDLQLLISGGEFYVKATKNGQSLDLTCSINLVVPAGLTDGVNPGMTLWEGIITDTINGEEELIWDELDQDNPGQGENGVIGEGTNYYCYFGNFGWTNVDIFYSDPRPKTQILADVPNGYDGDNSAVYLSYDGEGNGLAKLDVYTAEGYFSEHYGQIPIGLECHAIFITEEDGQYRYAIKAVTIAAGEIITFAFDETITGTEAELVAAINAVQD